MAETTKWTPGPWEVAVVRRRAGAYDTVYGPERDDGGTREVAIVSCDADACAGANAALIAAAPDLHAELRGIGIMHEGESEPCYCGMPTARHMAYCLRIRRVLARAEGR